jgi:hypothetical protein
MKQLMTVINGESVVTEDRWGSEADNHFDSHLCVRPRNHPQFKLFGCPF